MKTLHFGEKSGSQKLEYKTDSSNTRFKHGYRVYMIYMAQSQERKNQRTTEYPKLEDLTSFCFSFWKKKKKKKKLSAEKMQSGMIHLSVRVCCTATLVRQIHR